MLFVTVDSKLYRLRWKYPFIISPEQFLEFILPYLFLSDIPVHDADRFPNQLLTAQLGTLLVKRPPKLVEIVGAFFRNPTLANVDSRVRFPTLSEEQAQALNSERFREVVTESDGLSDEQRAEVATQATEALEQLVNEARSANAVKKELEELREGMADREAKIDKLQRTVKYWRAQSRRK